MRGSQTNRQCGALTGGPRTLSPGSPFSPWSPGRPGTPLSPLQQRHRANQWGSSDSESRSRRKRLLCTIIRFLHSVGQYFYSLLETCLRFLTLKHILPIGYTETPSMNGACALFFIFLLSKLSLNGRRYTKASTGKCSKKIRKKPKMD